MNRHQRRAAAAQLRNAAPIVPRGTGMHGVVLAGGPMDGWVVKPDAPALQPDWYKTLPPRPQAFLSRISGRLAAEAPGRYVLEAASSPPRATWQLVGQG